MALGAMAMCLAGVFSEASRASEPTGPLETKGRYLVDPAGRVMILNGIFAVWKSGSLGPVDDPTSPNAFTGTDAAAIREAGFDLVRLAWFWEALEPTQGIYSDGYLDNLVAAEEKLADSGIYTLLDAHQDQYNRTFGDKPGLPDWTVQTNGIAPDPKPFPLGYFKAATGAAFSNLYANSPVAGEGIADAFADAWKRVAGRFTDAPLMLGYDLVNEPFPGTPTGMDSDCASPGGCAGHDKTVNQPFQDKLARSIREVDQTRPVFYEPTFFFNSGTTNHFDAPETGLAPAGFSFHGQCSTHGLYQATGDESLIAKGHEVCPEQEIRIWTNAEATRTRIGGPMLMTEVTGTGNEDDQGLNCQLEKAEQFRTGFTFGMGPGRLQHADLLRPGAPFQRKVLSRVHPQAIAGIPIEYRFDVRTGTFKLRYWVDQTIDRPTVVVVPEVQYELPYEASVSGGKVTSLPGSDRLTIEADGDIRQVSIEVKPAAGDPTPRPQFPPCLLGQGPPDDPPPAWTEKPLRLKLLKTGPIRTRALVRSRKFKVTSTCSRACKVRVSLRLTGKRPRRTTLVRSRKSIGLAAGVPKTTALKLGKKALRILRKSRSVKLNLKVSAHGGGAVESRTRKLRVR